MGVILTMCGAFAVASVLIYVLRLAAEEWLPHLRVLALKSGLLESRGMAALRILVFLVALLAFGWYINRAFHLVSFSTMIGTGASCLAIWTLCLMHLDLAEQRIANQSFRHPKGNIVVRLAAAKRLGHLRKKASRLFALLFLLVAFLMAGGLSIFEIATLPSWAKPAADVLYWVAHALRGLKPFLGSIVAGLVLLLIVVWVVVTEARETDSAESLARSLLSHAPGLFANMPSVVPLAPDTTTSFAYATNAGLLSEMVEVLLRTEETADQVYMVRERELTPEEVDLGTVLPEVTVRLIEQLRDVDERTAARYVDLIRSMISRLRSKQQVWRAAQWEAASEAL
jgi:hypothetical protein